MPVMGPTYSEREVDEIYDKFMKILAEEHSIQKFPVSNFWPTVDWSKDRQERNAQFKEAIRRLVELEAWESW